MGKDRKNKIVFVDFRELKVSREAELGRPLSKVEENILSGADAIRMDALACGRSVATTVENIEKYGGEVSDAVKAALGLIPSVN